jgi:hypothetical protein
LTLRSRLALLCGLTLRSRLTLRSGLALLLGRLALRGGLALLLLCLALRGCLMLLLNRLALLLLRYCTIGCLQGRRGPHVAICRKRLIDSQTGWTTVVDAGKLGTVGAGHVLILNLCMHGRGMGFVASRQLRRSGAHL